MSGVVAVSCMSNLICMGQGGGGGGDDEDEDLREQRELIEMMDYDDAMQALRKHLDALSLSWSSSKSPAGSIGGEK